MSTIVANIIRNGRIESQHRGHIAVVNEQGRLLASAGDPLRATYIRSAAKPFQIMPLIQNGVAAHYDFSGEEIAVIMASHNGEPMHVEAVKSMLAKVDLPQSALQCAFHRPMHDAAAKQHLQSGLPESALYNNCSGKHTGMLAVAKFFGWPLDSYLDFEHPVQRKILSFVARFAGLEEREIGVAIDGCSAPVFYMSLANMAAMYARLAHGEISPAASVFDYMVAHPEMVAGTGRFDSEFMRAMNGTAVSKVGAEGIRCVGVKGERAIGIALKIEDGSKRASEAVLLEVLAQLEVISAQQLQDLNSYRRPKLCNHAGLETGHIEVAFSLKFAADVAKIT